MSDPVPSDPVRSSLAGRSAPQNPSATQDPAATQNPAATQDPAAPQSPAVPLNPTGSPASRDGFLSSGQSPGVRVHLVGPGHVGRAFLQSFDARSADCDLRLVAVSDRSGTVFDRDGLASDQVLACKRQGRSLAELATAESLPTELAIRLVSADIVVDATPSSTSGVGGAVLRGRAALQCGASLVLCGKNALAVAGAEWLSPSTRSRVGIDATLGGTGADLVRELDELRADCAGLALVGNVTTTAIVTAVEQGASIDEGIAEAQRLGFLEPDATLDLDGSDAATKLLCVWSAVFGSTFCKSPSLAAVARQDVRDLDAGLLRERARRGATTRLLARGGRSASDLRVAFEEVPLGSKLAAPPDRVVYGYELPSGLRVHTGLGVGYQRTANALWNDVTAFAVAAKQEAGQ